MIDLEVVVVAGGRGTRLKPILGDTPKVLAEFGGKSNLSRIVELVNRHGGTKVTVLAGVGASKVAQEIDRLKILMPHVRIELLIEEQELGTAGCFNVLKGRRDHSSSLLVIYGDILCDFSIPHFLHAHEKSECLASVFVQPNNHLFDSDLVELSSSGKIKRIHKKPHSVSISGTLSLTNAAVYLIKVEALDRLNPGCSDWFHDVFPRLIADGYGVYGYDSSEYLHDYGTEERYAKALIDIERDIVGKRNKGVIRNSLFLIERLVRTSNIDQRNTLIDLLKIANEYRIPIVLMTEGRLEPWIHWCWENNVYFDHAKQGSSFRDIKLNFVENNNLVVSSEFNVCNSENMKTALTVLKENSQ
ncbi:MULTISPECIES: nucleotidyltransferase family protein [Thalassospira]|uniref:Nucleotidyl transferase domain-containing protein n=2 Tax=Thalassospira TaxID=168934 RepID=A0A367WC72_9PROT|nr:MULTISPECIES: nucleotidyltransferase family protein [Thalassospira]MDG4717683.1 nucleotidyltransferase family protein [Thalassospira sp. FZY0004]RCK38859.1 hypothetical protein TH19_03410 [Thalassospira profundimaris]